jgi:hypothetical protein
VICFGNLPSFRSRHSRERHEGQLPVYFLNLTIPGILLLIGFGGYFLYDSMAHSGPQLSEVIGGASSAQRAGWILNSLWIFFLI